MNRDSYLENLEIKNRRLLLKIYQKYVNKLKSQIFAATERGNDTTYLQNLQNQVEKEIAKFEKELKQYATGAVKTSYESGAKAAVVGETVKEIAGSYVFGAANNEAMRVLAQTTYEPLSKMAQQIGRSTRDYMKRENFQDTQTVLKALGKFIDSDYLRKTGIEGIGNVVVGSESWQTAARKIRDKIILEAGIKVPYYNKKGDAIRYVNAQDYAKMVSRTTTANVFREGAKDRILDTFDEGDLVEIIGVSNFPDSPCIPYQGKILSLEGRTKGFTTIKEAKANGLFHPNCIHNFAVTQKVMDIYDKMDEKEDIKEDVEQTKANSENITEGKYENAKSLKEAKEYANRFVKNGKSSFDNNITLDNLNQFNEQMTYLTKKYNYSEYEIVGSFTYKGKNKPNAHASLSIIEIEKSFGMKNMSDFKESFAKMSTNYQQDCLNGIKIRENHIKFYNSFLGNDRYDQRKIKRITNNLKKEINELKENSKFIRSNAKSSAENLFKDTINHEFGHSLLYRAASKNTKINKIVEKAYKNAQETGDIYNISKYANKSYHEFFAEVFSIYERGIEKLPEYINNMIKEVIKI